MAKRQRRSYSDEYKLQAVDLVLSSGRSAKSVSKELGLDRQEVIKVCVEEGVPIYQGKIDKYLFQAQLQAISAQQPAA